MRQEVGKLNVISSGERGRGEDRLCDRQREGDRRANKVKIDEDISVFFPLPDPIRHQRKKFSI